MSDIGLKKLIYIYVKWRDVGGGWNGIAWGAERGWGKGVGVL